MKQTYPQKNFYLTNNFFLFTIKRDYDVRNNNTFELHQPFSFGTLLVYLNSFTIKVRRKLIGFMLQKTINKIIVVLDAAMAELMLVLTIMELTKKDLTLQLLQLRN
jgi:hypothetical protein